jgi:UDP-2,3-diacylglucosamine pyrophosphatase LpxH
VHYEAASALFARGFDAVVFGHTHHPELTVRPDGLFVNGGDWMTQGTYVAIDDGEVTLHHW